MQIPVLVISGWTISGSPEDRYNFLSVAADNGSFDECNNLTTLVSVFLLKKGATSCPNWLLEVLQLM